MTQQLFGGQLEAVAKQVRQVGFSLAFAGGIELVTPHERIVAATAALAQGLGRDHSLKGGHHRLRPNRHLTLVEPKRRRLCGNEDCYFSPCFSWS